VAPEHLSLVDTLQEHERAWTTRPVVRDLYHRWFQLIRDRLANVPGPTVELGGGLGHLRELIPDVVVTDIEPTPWADTVVDAENIPYEDGSIANLVLFDVFHHLPVPARFLDEAARTLAVGGRVVAVEPYCSPVSAFAYRRFHHEPVDFATDPFSDSPQSTAAAMDSNSALPTLAFFRQRDRLTERWPELALVETQRFSFLAYPLSGGFSRPQLVPRRVVSLLDTFERSLAPLGPLAAFRCLVVLERRGDATGERDGS
jgi:SAM-dependent methyltransferase